MRLLPLLLVLLPAPTLAQPAADSAAAFAAAADAFYAETLAAVGAVPGVAVAVVRGDETVYARGFGMADREAGLEATPHTPFYIASATKPFTALAAALLHHRGEIDLDAPLTQYTPGIAFDNVDAGAVTLRDLLTHTHGLENSAIGLRTAFTGEHTPEDLWALLAATEPNESAPHGTFDYTNVGYNILSLVLDRVTERPWQDLLDDLVFQPAGMDRTTAYASEAAAWGRAAPYLPFGLDGTGGPVRIYLEKDDTTMQAAGGMYATADDLARWVRLQLNGGRLDGEQVFPEAVIAATHRSHAEVDASFGPFSRGGYGLGWYVGDYNGDVFMHHFGGFGGFHAHVSFMPEHDLGVVVLANEAMVGGRLVPTLATFAYEWWLGRPNVAERYAAQREALRGGMERGRQSLAEDFAKRAERTWTLAAPMAAYAGTYRSPLHGTLVVTVEDGAPHVQLGNLRADATPFTEPNTMRVTFLPPRGEVVAFELDAEGRPVAARYDDATFERVE